MYFSLHILLIAFIASEATSAVLKIPRQEELSNPLPFDLGRVNLSGFAISRKKPTTFRKESRDVIAKNENAPVATPSMRSPAFTFPPLGKSHNDYIQTWSKSKEDLKLQKRARGPPVGALYVQSPAAHQSLHKRLDQNPFVSPWMKSVKGGVAKRMPQIDGVGATPVSSGCVVSTPTITSVREIGDLRVKSSGLTDGTSTIQDLKPVSPTLNPNGIFVPVTTPVVDGKGQAEDEDDGDEEETVTIEHTLTQIATVTETRKVRTTITVTEVETEVVAPTGL